MKIKRRIVTAVETACWIVDNIPVVRRTDEGWRIRASQWGCWPLRLTDFALWLDKRWKTGVWWTINSELTENNNNEGQGT